MIVLSRLCRYESRSHDEHYCDQSLPSRRERLFSPGNREGPAGNQREATAPFAVEIMHERVLMHLMQNGTCMTWPNQVASQFDTAVAESRMNHFSMSPDLAHALQKISRLFHPEPEASKTSSLP
jgi:hypothetical protein